MNLFIDTHLNDVVIIIYNDKKIIKKEIILNVKKTSSVLMPTIKKVIDGKKIASILVVNGPGSFTSVRLGVTVAKALAMTLDVPIKTITSLECLAVSLDDCNKIAGFSDKNGYYIGIFDNEFKLIGNYEYLSNKEFTEFNQIHPVQIDVKPNYEKIFEYAKSLDYTKYHQVNPVYIKKLDVEK